MVERTETEYFGNLKGHMLQVPGVTEVECAVCECGAQSKNLLYSTWTRRAWHRKHKGAVVAKIIARLKAEREETSGSMIF